MSLDHEAGPDLGRGAFTPSRLPTGIPVSPSPPPEASVHKADAALEMFPKLLLPRVGLVPGLGARLSDQWPSGGFGV